MSAGEEAKASSTHGMGVEVTAFIDSWYERNHGASAERLTKEDFLGADSPWRKSAAKQQAELQGRPKALDPKKKVTVTLHEKVRTRSLDRCITRSFVRKRWPKL